MDDEEKGDDAKRKRRRGPRKVTATYLENAAAHYLGRFASSKANLRRIMMQKVNRSVHHHGTDPAEGAKFVDDVIAKFERLGYLDDAAYAAMMARSLHGRGTPVRGIRYALQNKGVDETDIETGLSALMEEEEAADLDLAAAVRLARRRRLGPFRGDDPEVRRERREKDLATLARAGFSYDVAQQIVEADSVDDLDYLVASS